MGIMMYGCRQLKYVLEVAVSSSMREAATKLFVTQPALSASIHELEEDCCYPYRRVAREIEVAKRLKEHYDGKVPVVATVFTPLIRVVLVVSQTVYRYNET